ncbi:MAG: hypothetical protein ACW98D_21235, partial [Promethearchaeota archaeon]
MIIKDKKILIISTEPWGANFVSKHHYAMELSKSNKVYFLNPPSSNFSIENINDNLSIIKYKPIIRGINKLPSILRDYINAIDIHRIKKRVHVHDFDIIWTFDPFRFQNLKLFSSPILIYHPVDVHYTFLEKEIAMSAHLILTTCDHIKRTLKPYNSNIHNIGHGVSKNIFIEHSISIARSEMIKVCMMGNLQRKIDYPVLFTLIQNNPDVDFHFIGPYMPSNLSNLTSFNSEIEKLKSFTNTYLHGSVPQDQLSNWLKQ